MQVLELNVEAVGLVACCVCALRHVAAMTAASAQEEAVNEI